MRSRPTQRPLLIFAPEVDVPQSARQASIDDPQTIPAWARGPAQAGWADVSFWIAPDGTVGDGAVLRTSARGVGPWLQAVTKALPQRRYGPLALAPNSPGLARVERYSYIYDQMVAVDSRMTARSPFGRLKVLELTEEPDRG
jgi:hypothetical protein